MRCTGRLGGLLTTQSPLKSSTSQTDNRHSRIAERPSGNRADRSGVWFLTERGHISAAFISCPSERAK